MPFSKCLRAKIYSNLNVYFDQLRCQTLLLKESDPLLFSLGSWTIAILVFLISITANTNIYHRRRKVQNIGGPRFRMLLGPRGGQIPSRHVTS